MRQRRTVQGYLDMGRQRFPITPTPIALTDRDDGTVWLVSHSSRDEWSPDGFGHIAISHDYVQPPAESVITYPVGEEPVISTEPLVRLIVRGGRLGYSVEDMPVWQRDRDQARLMTRRGSERFTREIIRPTGWAGYPATLAWSAMEDV